MNKDGFIDYLVDVFKEDSSDAYESDAFESDAEVTDTPNKDGIELAERPESAQKPPTPESSHGKTQSIQKEMPSRISRLCMENSNPSLKRLESTDHSALRAMQTCPPYSAT